MKTLNTLYESKVVGDLIDSSLGREVVAEFVEDMTQELELNYK